MYEISMNIKYLVRHSSSANLADQYVQYMYWQLQHMLHNVFSTYMEGAQLHLLSAVFFWRIITRVYNDL